MQCTSNITSYAINNEIYDMDKLITEFFNEFLKDHYAKNVDYTTMMNDVSN